MYRRQRGLLPIVSTIIGFAALLFSVIVSLDFIMRDITEQIGAQDFTVIKLVSLLVANILAALLFLSPLWLIGGFLVFLFPEVRLVSSGLKYRGLMFTGLIKWDEIENIFELQNGTIILVINRKGFYLLNGLYFNKLYGLIVRHEMPVIFLSTGLKDREQILAETMKNSQIKTIRARSDIYT